MIERNDYFNLKREIKNMSYNNVLKLCENMMLNTEEKKLLVYFYDGKTKVQTCMDFHIGSTTYTTRMKQLFTKIYNYKNTLD